MSGKNQYPLTLNWQSTDPRTGFLPTNPNTVNGSKPSGMVGGVMTSTNVIYSQIFELSRMDNIGLEIAWSGTPTGTLLVYVSNSGINWPSLVFNPAYAQPSGSAGVEGLNINQYPFKWMMLQYTNASGSGVLTAYGQNKDLN
jgi:hypothetical protein